MPLYGDFGTAGAAKGQKVIKVDLTDPAQAAILAGETFDLGGVDLKPFDGGTPVARPFAIAAHQGKLYVALNNLNPNTYAPEGPGLLAKLDPVTRAITTVDLGPSCLNPIWVVSDGAQLYVSCQGKVTYSGPPTYAVSSAESTGVVVVSEDQVLASWAMACPSDAGTGCLPAIASRLAVLNKHVYVGDQNGGRLFVLENVGNQLLVRRGFAADGGVPIQACAVNPTTGVSNVSDVIAIP